MDAETKDMYRLMCKKMETCYLSLQVFPPSIHPSSTASPGVGSRGQQLKKN